MAASKAKYGYNPEPRLSANQLAEYLTASPTRRKSIIKSAKFPKTVVVAHYDGAWKAITTFLFDQTRSPATLAEALLALKGKSEDSTQKPWVRDDSRLSIEAIVAFQKAYNSLGLASLECRPVVGSQPKLNIAGVDISIALDATLHQKEKVGGAIMFFSKTESSVKDRAERGRVSAVLASLFTQEHLDYLGEYDRKLCMSVDIFGGQSFQCPSSFKLKISHMEGSCEEVALRWPSTFAPDDYDGPPWV